MNYRSNLFLPSHVEKYYKIINKTNFDNYILDLEDSVPKDKKNYARKLIKKLFLNTKKIKNIFIRINDQNSKEFLKDIFLINEMNADNITIILPKVNSKKDVITFLKKIKNKRKVIIFPIIETSLSLINLEKIAKSSNKIKGLILGSEDLISDFSTNKNSKNILNLGRFRCLIVAKALKIKCIDTVITDVKNLRYFKKFCTDSFNDGFDGILCLTPKQAEIAKDKYSVPKKSYLEAINLIKKYNLEKKSNVFLFKHKNKSFFLSPPTIRILKNLINKYEEQQ